MSRAARSESNRRPKPLALLIWFVWLPWLAAVSILAAHPSIAPVSSSDFILLLFALSWVASGAGEIMVGISFKAELSARQPVVIDHHRIGSLIWAASYFRLALAAGDPAVRADATLREHAARVVALTFGTLATFTGAIASAIVFRR